MGLKSNIPILQYSNRPFPQDTARGEAVKFYSLCRMVAPAGYRKIASWHAQKRITGLPNNYASGQASWNREQTQFTTKPTS